MIDAVPNHAREDDRSRPPFDERAIANHLLDFAEARHVGLSNLHLQKILFFCHGWYLAETRSPLVRGMFEAWPNGPVLRSIYDAFKQFRERSIKSRATRIDLQTGQLVIAQASVPEQTKVYIEKVALLYLNYTAFDIANLSHAVDSPWYRVRYTHNGKVNIGLQISNESIAEYFMSDRISLPRA